MLSIWISQDFASYETSAEAQAAIQALKLARKLKVPKIINEGNSKTVIYVLRGHLGSKGLKNLGINDEGRKILNERGLGGKLSVFPNCVID